MLNLTEEQKTFLDKYNLNIDMVFDASWMKRKEYSPIMKELEKHIAIGVIPCAKAWHTMRTSFWSCLQCNTQSIAYINRRHEKHYNCWWKDMISYEIFSCSYKTIKDIFEQVKSE